MQIYAGICANCFEPIRHEQLFRFHEKGRAFHRECVEKNPNGYYIRKEAKKGGFQHGVHIGNIERP
jgi:hypothetical protein